MRGEGNFPLQQLPHSFPVRDADLSHARAISALGLYIHHIPELDYSSQMYFMCVTQIPVYV